MSPGAFKDWLVPVSTIIGTISASVSVAFVAWEYRIKLKAETRLERATEAEINIRLLTTFSELMKIAHSRTGHAVSEKAVEWYLSQHARELNYDLDALRANLERVAVLSLPAGIAATDAAVASISILAEQYPEIREVVRQGLHSLKYPGASEVVGEWADRVEALFPSTAPTGADTRA